MNKTGGLTKWDKSSKHVSGTISSMLNEVEGVLIVATEPPFNKQGARFRGIESYRQAVDAKAEFVRPTDLRKLLEDISKKIDAI